MSIKMENVFVTFNRHSNSTVHALNGISLEVKKGEWLNILGPSGSGKTTLLNVIGGMIKPTEGEIQIEGDLLTDFSSNQLQEYRRNRIGYIFQDYRLFDQYTVLENVMIPQWPYMDKKELEKKSVKVLEKLQMNHRLHSLPNELSGGEKQRTAIARALLHGPSILLCDEPTGNLDEENRNNILTILHTLHQEGMTIILVTHDLEVATWGDRKIYIRDGRIQEMVKI
jgi:putative ABC transport system ATP-binding protein